MADDPTNEWDAEDYDSSHDFVYEYGSDVVDLLSPAPGERILDIGCGTGHLTAEIGEAVGPDGEVVGLDQSAEMIAQARESYPDIRFVQADARDFTATEPFDAVFSNAALHWIPDQQSVVSTVASLLRQDGRFVAEMGGAGNVATIIETVQTECEKRGYTVENPWYFPTVGEQATLLEAENLEVTFARLFDRPTELDGGPDGLANWLAMFGDSPFEALPAETEQAVIEATEDRLRPSLYDEQSQTWTADYRRLRFVAHRV